MVVKTKAGADRKGPGSGVSDGGRVVKTSPRFGRLTPAQVRRAVETVRREGGLGAGLGETPAKG